MFSELNCKVIPLAKVPKAAVDKAGLTREKRLVLVVDDEHIIADTLSVILSKNGFAVMTAYDGESALELARISAPDLLLSDVMLGPGMDGTQLAIQVTTDLPDCKVLLFSGHAATAVLLASARQQGHKFTLMAKPVHPRDLLARISETLTLEQDLAS